jgi:hypothetical protein
MIYFVGSPEGPIKIGTTIRLSERIKSLVNDYGEWLQILGVVDGSYSREKELHAQFSHLRIGGEWFRTGDDLMAFISSETRPWDHEDESPRMAVVKFDRTLAQKSKLIASRMGIDMSQYIIDIAKDGIERDFARVVQEMI